MTFFIEAHRLQKYCTYTMFAPQRQLKYAVNYTVNFVALVGDNKIYLKKYDNHIKSLFRINA